MKLFTRNIGAAVDPTVVSMPGSWDAVRFDQYLALAGLEKATIRTYLETLCPDINALHDRDAGTLAGLVASIEFIKEEPSFMKLDQVEPIAGIMPPEEVNLCPLIQFWCVEQWVEERIEDGYPDTEATWYLPLLAVYLYPKLTGETFTDLKQAESIVEQINAFPCLEAVPLARFYLRQYTDSRNYWPGEFTKPVPSSQAEEMARGSVPEMEDFAREFQIEQVGGRRRITDEAVYQLAYDDFMNTLVRMHFESFYQYQVSENQRRLSKFDSQS